MHVFSWITSSSMCIKLISKNWLLIPLKYLEQLSNSCHRCCLHVKLTTSMTADVMQTTSRIAERPASRAIPHQHSPDGATNLSVFNGICRVLKIYCAVICRPNCLFKLRIDREQSHIWQTRKGSPVKTISVCIYQCIIALVCVLSDCIGSRAQEAHLLGLQRAD